MSFLIFVLLLSLISFFGVMALSFIIIKFEGVM